MTGDPTTIDDHDGLAYGIHRILQEFIDEIGDRNCTGHFDKVVTGKHFLKGRHLIQEPERFIEDYLVFPLLVGPLEHEIRPRPKQYAPRWPRQGGVPDFCLTTISVAPAMDADLRVFGEVKPPKKLERGRKELVEYLNGDLELDAIAVLTDGFDWELWVRPRGQTVEIDDEPYAEAGIRDSLKAIRARNMEVESQSPHAVRTERIDPDSFSEFTAESVREIIDSEFDASIVN